MYYYLTNQKNQIIAADDKLLTLLEVGDIEELSKKIILDDISFISSSEESITINMSKETLTYTTSTSVLSSLLGDIHLIMLTPIMDTKAEEIPYDTNITDISNTTLSDTDIKELLVVNDPKISSDELISPIEETEDISLIDNDMIPDDELFTLTIPKVADESIEEIRLESDNETSLILEAPEKISLLDDNISDDSISIDNTIKFPDNDELFDTKTPDKQADTTPIVIYVDEVSQSIGISSEDYNNFLEEYLDTALSLKEDIQSDDSQQRNSALKTLTQLANVLELPKVDDIISELGLASLPKRKELISSFYTLLSNLTVKNKNITTDSIDVVSDKNTQVSLENKQKGFGTLSLDNIKPIHFHFKLEEASNDLSLPIELIEEFVHDFIEQAHIETKKMLIAYEKGDLDTIQKIGHMLKGASSNLRISALSDTLYQIQFCKDSSKIEGFIKQYWANFLSFEQQIDVLSNKGSNL